MVTESLFQILFGHSDLKKFFGGIDINTEKRTSLVTIYQQCMDIILRLTTQDLNNNLIDLLKPELLDPHYHCPCCKTLLLEQQKNRTHEGAESWAPKFKLLGNIGCQFSAKMSGMLNHEISCLMP